MKKISSFTFIFVAFFSLAVVVGAATAGCNSNSDCSCSIGTPKCSKPQTGAPGQCVCQVDEDDLIPSPPEEIIVKKCRDLLFVIKSEG